SLPIRTYCSAIQPRTSSFIPGGTLILETHNRAVDSSSFERSRLPESHATPAVRTAEMHASKTLIWKVRFIKYWARSQSPSSASVAQRSHHGVGAVEKCRT